MTRDGGLPAGSRPAARATRSRMPALRTIAIVSCARRRSCGWAVSRRRLGGRVLQERLYHGKHRLDLREAVRITEAAEILEGDLGPRQLALIGLGVLHGAGVGRTDQPQRRGLDLRWLERR